MSRKSLVALSSPVECQSRYLMLTRLDAKIAEATSNAVIERLKDLPGRARRILTPDNGTENASHEEITVAIGTKCYFARPYASWQCGVNEHMNGLIR